MTDGQARTPAKKSNRILLAVLAVAGVVVLGLALVAAVALPTGGPEFTGGPRSQPVRDADSEFTVSAVGCDVDSSAQGWRDRKPSAGSVFCMATVAIRNVGDHPIRILSQQKAYDADGREFTSDADASSAANDDSLLFRAEYAPGSSRSVLWVWQLPIGHSIERLELHQTLHSDGAEVTVR